MLTGCGAARPPSNIELDVPFLAQGTLLRVPTSAAMVLAFYGDAQPPRKLEALAAGRAYARGRLVERPRWGNSNSVFNSPRSAAGGP